MKSDTCSLDSDLIDLGWVGDMQVIRIGIIGSKSDDTLAVCIRRLS